jgi:hypothetical protein
MNPKARLLLALIALPAVMGAVWRLDLTRGVDAQASAALPLAPSDSVSRSVAQAGTIDVRVDPATQTVPVDGDFAVDIVADIGSEMDPDGLGAYEFDLVDALGYTEVITAYDAGDLGSTGNRLWILGPSITTTMGTTVSFGAVAYPAAGGSMANGPTGTVTLATVELRGKQAGHVTLSLDNVRLADTQGVGWPGDGRSLNLQGGTVTIGEPGTLGDVNGDDLVNSTDALIILSCDVGLNTSAFCPMDCGDVNDDGLINSTDALIILSYDVGLSVPFPVGEPGCPSGVTPCPGCNP